MARSAYTVCHHFTAALLTLPFLSTVSDGASSELFKMGALAAVWMGSAYYFFLYKYDVMLTLGLVVSSIFGVVFLFALVWAALWSCWIGCTWDSFERLVYGPLHGIAALGLFAVFGFLNLALLLAYWFAGRRLGLRESYE
ncbi:MULTISPECIES: hypothetical protein [Rhodomicrobium]|uniref:hypothetical protein n=1 Tax=Rhodomicrobium TaxID=1068 RepID=UPI000F737FD0|nr:MULTISPECIES: hypothetical protein [Rhodomicrobium]